MSEDLDIVTTKVDDTFYINGQSSTIEDYLIGINQILREVQETDDFELGASAVRSMTGAAHAVGIGLAKILHGLYTLWGDRDGDFFEYMNEFTPITKLVMSRYIDAWNGYLQVPDDYKSWFLTMPMKNLNALGAAINQGYIPEGDDWDKLSDATGNTEFLKVLREDVKGCEPRKNSLIIYLEPNGDLVAWMGGERSAIGFLNIQDMEEDEILFKATNRIVKSAGLIKR